MAATRPAEVLNASARSWQSALRTAVRDIAELGRLLELPGDALAAVAAGDRQFPLLVPRSFVAKMRKGDLLDPLLKQVLPLAIEREQVAGYDTDPLREQSIATQGFLQKYAGRALLIASGACPVHCRYCFRRSFPYQTQLAARADWSSALRTLSASTGIKEVILSGGDPLSLSNRRVADLIGSLESIESLECVRIHTRYPIMIPERVDLGLERILSATRLRTVVVVHTNHPHELGDDVGTALNALRGNVDLLLNQSVLLRGVNDSADTLTFLSERLFGRGVLPYYLHLLDPVAGAAHFAVDEQVGLRLIAAVRNRLPGYLVPRLVREIPGRLGKTPIT
jgi:EF-P beta-lysylation protein EpmB